MKWQYEVITVAEEVLEDTLNEYGSHGWELVSSDSYVRATGEPVWTCIMKRRVDVPDRLTKAELERIARGETG